MSSDALRAQRLAERRRKALCQTPSSSSSPADPRASEAQAASESKMPETLVPARGFNLREGISVGSNQSSNPSLGCSKPLVAGDVVHVVLNERLSTGGVRSHFVSARLEDVGLEEHKGSGGSLGGGGGRVSSWCVPGRHPVRGVQPLDDGCSTLVYTQEGLFYFATARGREDGESDGDAAGDGTGGGAGGEGGSVSPSLPVHSGRIADFKVNSFSRDIISGGDDGHVHVLNFPPDMAGVPTMKASKYVGSPVSSTRWGLGQPFVASWTTSAGHLQMIDTRDYRVVCSIQVEGSLPVHTHEHISDVVLAVGCATGTVQLFDVRNMSAFLKLQDPVTGDVQQIIPARGEPALSGSGVGDWIAFGPGGISRYIINSDSNGRAVDSGVSSRLGGDVMARVAAGLSYSAGCRLTDLNLTADLDMNAGLFLAPRRSGVGRGGGQICGVDLNARVVIFSSSSSAGGDGASPKSASASIAGGASGASAAPPDGTAVDGIPK